MNINSLFMELYREKYGDHITPELAKDIVSDLPVTDGSGRDTGEKWTVNDAVGMAEKVAVDLNKVNKCEWYIVLNMMYSDYYQSVKRHALPDTFYGELAHDWFYDVDADDSKTFRYFMHF